MDIIRAGYYVAQILSVNENPICFDTLCCYNGISGVLIQLDLLQ